MEASYACNLGSQRGRLRACSVRRSKRAGRVEVMRVINLKDAPGSGEAWGAPVWKVVAWGVVELVLVSNPWQVSSRVRATALRVFGASIGRDVILRPRLRVRFPWKLVVGDRSWIGEEVWLHNQDLLSIGSDAVVSQGTFITTGSHALRRDMALLTRPVVVEDGAWVTARCIVLGGSRIGQSAVVKPGTIVSGDVPAGVVFGGGGGEVLGRRFPT